jgi:hypothetical protein
MTLPAILRRLIMTDGFKVRNGLKQGDGLAPNFFNTALHIAASRSQIHNILRDQCS